MSWIKVNGSSKSVVEALDSGAETVIQVSESVDYHEDTVRASLRKLEEQGAVESEKKPMDGGGVKTYYALTDDARVRHEADRYVKEIIPFPVLMMASVIYYLYSKVDLFNGFIGLAITLIPLLALRIWDIIGRNEGKVAEINVEEKEKEEQAGTETYDGEEEGAEEFETDLDLPEPWES